MSATYHNDPALERPDTTGLPAGSHTHRRISWSAIIGGVFLVVSVQLLLSLLGAGVGFSNVDVQAGTTPDASSFGIGAGVWWVVSSVIALLFGGYVSAWLAGIEIRWDGLLHGLITWAISSLLTIYLLSSAIGGIVGGGASALGGIVSAAGSGIKAAAQPVANAAGITPDSLRQQAQAYLKPTDPDPATMSPQDAQKAVVSELVTYAKGGPDAASAKQRIVAIMAAQQHISTEQASQQFDQAQSRLQQAKQEAIQTAKNVADAAAAAASKTSFAAFADLLIGAIAAAIGGSLAVQRRMSASRRAARS